MHITIDTNNITQPDLAILAFILQSADPTIDTDTVVGVKPATAQAPTEDKPKRTRRTKAQIEADNAAAAAEQDTKTEPTEEPTPASEDAESDATHAGSISIQEVTELATQLIQSDRAAMVELLGRYVPDGVAKRVSNVPDSELGKFAEEIRKKLA